MRVCEIVPSLEEKHGGPSRSVLALAQGLAQLGHEVELLATTPAGPSARRLGPLAVREFHRDWPAAFCPSQGLWRHLRGSAPEIIHHHSLWLRTLDYARRRAQARDVPLVISPRGMLNRWARQHHALRKQLARAVLHPGAFAAAAGWHATSTEEADAIRDLGFGQPICVAPNGVTAPTEQARTTARAFWSRLCPEVTQRPTALFYSRFHQKKRIVELIDLWLERAPADWLLLLVGLPEEYSVRQLETYVLRASGTGRIRIFDGEGLPAPYAVASLFLLPSHSENFGLVIAEAMVNGLPVVVTDATPWQAVNANGAGWCVRWDDYPATLQAALAEPAAQRRERGQRAQAYASAGFSWEQSARTLSAFYADLRAHRQTVPAAASTADAGR